jgi:hypothetical protein
MAAIGKNIEIVIKDGKAIITVDLGKDYGLSSSGKSRIIASSEGNASIPGAEDVKIGLNIYRKA